MLDSRNRNHGVVGDCQTSWDSAVGCVKQIWSGEWGYWIVLMWFINPHQSTYWCSNVPPSFPYWSFKTPVQRVQRQSREDEQAELGTLMEDPQVRCGDDAMFSYFFGRLHGKMSWEVCVFFDTVFGKLMEFANWKINEHFICLIGKWSKQWAMFPFKLW